MIVERLLACVLVVAQLATAATASDKALTDIKLRQKLISKVSDLARKLRWLPVANATVVERTLTKGNEFYNVSWPGGSMSFTRELWPSVCLKSGKFRPVRVGHLEPLPKLSRTDIARIQAVSRKVCQDFGVGPVSNFREVEANRTRFGMLHQAIRVECIMQTKATLPIHELSLPVTSMELDPESLTVTYIRLPLPVIVEAVKGTPDKEKAKQLIAEYANKNFKQNLDPSKITVSLCLIDWFEGDFSDIDAKRRYALRRNLKPFFNYKGTMGEIRLDANTMKIFVVKENPHRPTSSSRRPPPSL